MVSLVRESILTKCATGVHILFSVGAVYCNKTVPQMQEVVEQLSSDYDGLVKKGGAFTPTGCIAKNKVDMKYKEKFDINVVVSTGKLHYCKEIQ